MRCSNDKPIVHCKNCKFKVTDKDGNYNPYAIVCEYWNSDGLEENDFCSNGIEGKFEYDELAVTSDCKTYDEIVQESFESKNGMGLYFIQNQGCDATTYGLMVISDNLIDGFIKRINNLNRNSYYDCMPVISVKKVSWDMFREIKSNEEDENISVDDIFYVGGKMFTFVNNISWLAIMRLESLTEI